MEETETLMERARALQREIDDAEARIAKLQGRAVGRVAGSAKGVLTVEVERTLPPTDPARAHEVIAETLHASAGLGGAAHTEGGDFVWRPLRAQQARLGLEVRLLADARDTRLSIRRGTRLCPRDVAGAGAAGVLLGLAATLGLLVAGASSGVAVTTLLLIGVAAGLGASLHGRRSTRRELTALADRIGARLPLAKVRVSAAEPVATVAEEVEVVREAEVRRGVS